MGKYNDEELKEAVKELKRLSGDVEVMAAYDKEMEDKLDRILIRQEGVEEGIAKGLKQGQSDTIAQAAINLVSNGVTKKIICKSLKITLQELDNILKKNNNR